MALKFLVVIKEDLSFETHPRMVGFYPINHSAITNEINPHINLT